MAASVLIILTMKSSRTEYIDANGLKLCVRHWGNEDAPKLFMLHGWMDIAASFQFVVDAFKQDWHVICARSGSVSTNVIA